VAALEYLSGDFCRHAAVKSFVAKPVAINPEVALERRDAL
jgi:hypothetical protein